VTVVRENKQKTEGISVQIRYTP